MSNDTSKVTAIQDGLCEAITILQTKVLSDLKFDRTETATIIDDTEREKGIYKVRPSTGEIEYTATSTDTSFKNGTVVYITIPNGDYKEDKIIIGRKTSEVQQAIPVTHAFSNLIEMVGNKEFGINNKDEQGQEKEYALLANESNNDKEKDNEQIYILEEKELTPHLKGYTRFGIKADFRSFLQNAVFGDYGLRVKLYERVNTTIEETDNEERKYYEWVDELNVKKMFGNPYSFTGWFTQEYVWDIAGLGTIEKITLEFYQNKQFKDKNGEPLPTTESDDKTPLPNNLFVKNITMAMGYDTNDITDEFVTIYTFDNDTYTGDTDDIKKDNEKVIKLRWVHMDEQFGALDIADADKTENSTSQDGTTQTVAASSEASNEKVEDTTTLTKEDVINQVLANSKIEWFRYKLGAPSATVYSGAYWELIDRPKDANPFEYILSPDINLAQEQIKVIITYPADSQTHLYSNLITFYNEKDVSGINAGKYLSALTLKCDDNSYGNYFIYDQGYGLLDQSLSKEIKTITAHYDLNKTGDEIDAELLEAEQIAWTIPSENTMISSVDEEFEGFSYNKLYETRGKYFTEEENTNTNTRYEYSDEAKETLILKITQTYDDTTKKLIQENWNDGKRVINISYDDNGNFVSAIGKEIIGSYIKIINFSKYGYNSENELEASAPKYSIYSYDSEKQLYDINKPLRVYDKINKQITIYEYPDIVYDTEDTDKIKDYKLNNKFKYRINSIYTPNNSNNIIQCNIIKDGTKYSSSKELSFGIKGTADTDYTLVLDFDDNKNVLVIDSEDSYFLTLRLYDQDGKEINDFTKDKDVIWSLYGGSFNNDIKFIGGIENKDSDNNIISYTSKETIEIQQGTSINKNSIIIVQASIEWGDRELVTYLPIPITDNSNWNYIKGATRLNYLSDGSIDYDKQSYEVFTIDKEKIANINRSIINNGVNNADKYAPIIDTNTQGIKPINIYIDPEKARYAVKLFDGTNYWTNPILILQNRYPSSGINQWDGETLTLDDNKGAIYSSFIAAGKKDNNGQFSGVVLGEATEAIESSMRQTGVYGFNKGAMSYAFKEDGTAFIGKSGSGRIYFNGDNGTIYSGNWKINESSPTGGNGMKIDLDNGEIVLCNSSNQRITLDATATGTVNNRPLSIGTNFSVGWDGTIYAEGAQISGIINSNGGTFKNINVLSAAQFGPFTLSDGGLICRNQSTINTNYRSFEIANNKISFIGTQAGMGLYFYGINQYNSLIHFASIIGNQGIEIKGNSGALSYLRVTDIPANRQEGIYARFA